MFKILIKTSIIKTLLFNFRYLKFKDAIKLPIFVARRTQIVKLGGSVRIDAPIKTGMVRLGYVGLGTQDTSFDRTIWQVSGTMAIGGKVSIGRGCKISCGGIMTLGDNFIITGRSTLICKKNITFGKNFLMSWDCLLMDTDFHKIIRDGNVINPDAPINICDNVWIGCRTTILKGSYIPSNSVIAAGSLVARKLPAEGCIYGGNGNLLKEGIEWQY